MKTVIVFNHPYKSSFCHAILKSVIKGIEKTGNEYDLIHLDREQFNPVMTAADLKAFKDRKAVDPKVIEYKRRLELADHLVFIFPIWWELMPALTKGFIDKVIFPGIAYNYKTNGWGMVPLFEHLKGITVVTTMNTARPIYRIIFGNAVKRAIMTGTFWKTGYKNRKWINLGMVKSVSDTRRKKWLRRIENRFANL